MDKQPKKWPVRVVAFFALLALVVGGLALFRTFEDDSAPVKPVASFPPGGPAEFLYLDKARTASYLAQVEGGEEGKKKYIQKLTNSLNGKVNFEGAAEAGASHSEEDVVERVVTPSSSSLFFDLKKAMEETERGDLTSIKLNEFESVQEEPGEGRFVIFHTPALLSPSYLDQYLAVKRPHGVRDLFPPDGGGDAAAHNTSNRWAAWRFKGELGKDPRVDLAVRVRRPDRPGSVVYLLPIDGALLTEEQSLLSHGGGTLTIVGKIVRLWPQPGETSVFPAYVDNATRATWEGPLRSAPGELICRTNPYCKTIVSEGHFRGPRRQRVIEETRRAELRALHLETRIAKRGAVVLPIAIYK